MPFLLLQALEKKYEERTGQPTPERIDDYQGIKVVAGFSRTWYFDMPTAFVRWSDMEDFSSLP